MTAGVNNRLKPRSGKASVISDRLVCEKCGIKWAYIGVVMLGLFLLNEYNDIFPTPKKLNKAYIKIGLVTGLMTLGLLNFKKTSIFLIILMNLAPLGAMKVAEKGTKLQKRIIVGGTIMMLWTLVSISSTILICILNSFV
ncbi:MAG: hypothetical protein AB4368_12555 [Xenococcaceae cyanobacterium]